MGVQWEPDAKNRLVARLLDSWQGAQSSEPGATAPGVYPQPSVGPGGGLDYAAYNRSVPTKSTEEAVGEVVKEAKARGSDTPNIVELLKLAAIVPGAMVQGAINSAISGISLPGDVATGKTQVMDPATGKPTPEVVGRALDLTGLMSSGSFAGAPEGALASGATRRPMPQAPEDYMYHVTGNDRLADIQDAGHLGTFKPSHGTDQAAWPDGSTKKRSYWSKGAPNDSFYSPDQGPMRIIRTPSDAHDFKAERGTPDFYLEKKAPADKLEYLDDNGAWQPVLNAGTKEGAAVADVLGNAAKQPPWYSHAARVVDQLPTTKAPASQWLATLKNKGVKDEELEALNLPAGDRPITKDELKATIEFNTPQIDEVVKGGKSPPKYVQADVDAAEAQARRTGDWRAFERIQAEHEAQELGHGTAANYLDESDVEDAVTDEFAEEFRRSNPAATDDDVDAYLADDATVDAITDEAYSRINAKGPATKYSQYQLPGGENYREILVTTPGTTTKETWQLRYKDGSGTFQSYPSKAAAEEAINSTGLGDRVEVVPTPTTDTVPLYKSSHWDEPNVLGHMRVNDRQIPDNAGRFVVKSSTGEEKRFGSIKEAQDWSESQPGDWSVTDQPDLKTLHAEELQSDWHQAGKKYGYNTPAATEINAIAAKIQPNARPEKVEYGDILAAQEAGKITAQEAEKLTIWQEDFEGAATGHAANPVPDAPFKKSWPDLLLRRLVKRAVDEGYDAISWTGGEAQAERYDLSKQISSIAYDPETGHLLAWGTKPNPQRVLDEKGVKPDKLADYVGKEAADKIVNSPTSKGELDGATYNRLTGVDLKVGGDGMKAFYDQELPRRAKKLFGGQVEKKQLSGVAETKTTNPWTLPTAEDLGPGVEATGVNNWTAGGPTNKANPTVHVMRLTPEIKAKVKAGQPLFSTGVAIPGLDDEGDGEPRRGVKLTRVSHDPFKNG